jgi:hypothetical protein
MFIYHYNIFIETPNHTKLMFGGTPKEPGGVSWYAVLESLGTPGLKFEWEARIIEQF